MRRKLHIKFIVLLLLLVACSPIYAFELEPQSSTLIMSAVSEINTVSGKITVYGETHTYNSVSKISVTTYLQYWNGSRWVDYLSWSSEKSNTSYVSIYREVIPPRGYYYRVRSVHTAESAGIKETMHSTSSYIFY